MPQRPDNDGPTVETGVVLGIVNLDPDWNIEIQRAPDDGTGSPDETNAETLAILAGHEEHFFDDLPLDDKKRHYRWRTTLAGCSKGPWSEWNAAKPVITGGARPQVPQVDEIIDLEWDADQIDVNTSRVTLKFADHELRVTEIAYAIKPGGASSFNAWQTEASGDDPNNSPWDNTGLSSPGKLGTDQIIERNHDIDLEEKHNVQFKARIKYQSRDGPVRTKKFPAITMDIDKIAHVISLSAAVDANGNPSASASGDDDVAKIYITHTTDGTEPNDPTSTNATATINDRSGSVSLSGTVSQEGKVIVKARGENDDGSLAPADTILRAVSERGRDRPKIVSEDTEESDFDSDGTIEGRLSLEVIAGTGSYDIDFYTRQGRGSFPGTATSSHTSQSDGDIVEQDVDLTEKVNSWIKYEVFEAGTSTKVDSGVVGFDPDEIAEVFSLTATIDASGNPSATAKGDSDTAKIYITHTTDGSEPNDPTSANATATINDRSGSVSLSGTVSEGDKLIVKARGENANTTLAPADTIGRTVVERETDDDTQELSVTVSEDLTQSGSTGSLDLDIEDPQTRVTDVEFQKKTDSGGFGGTWLTSWDRSTGSIGSSTSLERGEDITLTSGHNVAIKWRVKWTDSAGNNRSSAGTAVFDSDVDPDVQITGTGQDEDDTVLLGLVGDEDTNDIRVTWNIGESPSEPSDPVGTDTNLGSSRGILDTGVTGEVGDIIWIKARGEDAGGSLASASKIAEAKLKISEGEITPSIQVDASQSGSTGSLDLTVSDPQTRVSAIEFQKKTDSGGFGGTWLTSWDRSTGSIGSSATLERGEDISYKEKHNVAIKWRVQYTDLSGNTQTIGSVFTFDIDNVAEVNTLVATIDESNGNVLVDAGGGEDVSSIRIRVGENSDPSDPDDTASDDASISGRSGSVDTGVSIAEGSTAHVKARGKNSDGNLGPVKTAKALFRTDNDRPAIVAVETEESDFNSNGVVEGRLTLEIIADTGTYDIEFYTRQGRGAFSNTPDKTETNLSDGDTVQQDVNLIEDLNSFIKYIVLNNGTSTKVDAGIIAFDRDSDPNVQIQSIGFDSNGNQEISVQGDSDAVIGYAVVGDGSDPADIVQTTLDSLEGAGSSTISVVDASDFSAGDGIQIGAAGDIEDHVVDSVDTVNDNITLSSTLNSSKNSGEPVVRAHAHVDGRSGLITATDITISAGDTARVKVVSSDGSNLGSQTATGRQQREDVEPGLKSFSLDSVNSNSPSNGQDTYNTSWTPNAGVDDDFTLTMIFLRSAESFPASPSSFDADGNTDETSPSSTNSSSDTVTSGGTSNTHKVEWTLKDGSGNVVDSGSSDQQPSFD